MAPRQVQIGNPPEDFPAQTVAIESKCGSNLRGWWISGRPGKGVVVLMHGVRSNRLGLLERARFLHRDGFGVLLFDFQAHGESVGDQITFGRLESLDASAAVGFLKSTVPHEKIGVIGASLGGAAALLADPSLDVDAMVLEAVYPTIQQAVENRLAVRFGPPGKWLAPLLTCQLRPRLGFGADALRPIVNARSVEAPKLFIAGSADKETTEAESRELFAQAASPKEFWLIEGAGHVDLHAFSRDDYERRILAFLGPRLKSPSTNAE